MEDGDFKCCASKLGQIRDISYFSTYISYHRKLRIYSPVKQSAFCIFIWQLYNCKPVKYLWYATTMLKEWKIKSRIFSMLERFLKCSFLKIQSEQCLDDQSKATKWLLVLIQKFKHIHFVIFLVLRLWLQRILALFTITHTI